MLVLAQICGFAAPAQIRVDPRKILNRISQDMYGSCIEDVNHEIYGGLYAQRIFGESFEEPAEIISAAGWHTLGGDWKSTGQAVSCSAGNGPMLLLEHRNVTDGAVEAQIRVAAGETGSAGLILRVRNASAGVDNFDGYEIAFQAKAGTLALSRHRHDYHLLCEAPAPITAGAAHRLRAVLKGARIQVFLDSEAGPRLDFTDQDQPILSGTIALRTWQSDCRFEDVKILGEPVSVELKAGGISEMWDPVGKARFSLDRDAYNGKQCQKVVNALAGNLVGVANKGLNRWGISIRSGQTMVGRIALRGDSGTAVVALQSKDGTRTYASQTLSVTKNWRMRAFRLTPVASDPQARFAVLTTRAGSLSIDQAVLLDGDQFRGQPLRGDIARAMKSEKLTFLRYGGTMVNVPGYRWKNMIGEPDRRPPYRGNWYPFSTNGFGIFEFLRFCEAARFRSAFAINIEETPQDAADLADYLTAPVSNSWGARRAADGHPIPYHPEYIEIGNEEGIGGSPHAELNHYAERFRLLEKAIHGRNPNLRLVCAAWWIDGSPDMKTVFDAVDGRAVAWDIHVGADELNCGAEIDRELTQVANDFRKWNPRSGLKSVVFEENGGLHNLQRALGHAAAVNATRRHGDFVLADCPANCLQPLGENDNGWDQGQIFFTPSQVWGMPPFYAQQMLSQDRQPLRVSSTSRPELDVVAARSEDERSLVLTVVNTSAQQMATRVEIAKYAISAASARCLSGNLDAVNSTSGPARTSTRAVRLTFYPNAVDITFPAHSVTSVRIAGSAIGGPNN